MQFNWDSLIGFQWAPDKEATMYPNEIVPKLSDRKVNKIILGMTGWFQGVGSPFSTISWCI
jgi:hypothetical protein